MGRSDGSKLGARRRTVLKLLGATAGAGALPALGAGQTEDGEYAVVQGDDCISVTPLSGEQPVEELYDWREEETGYSSAGTVDLQRDDTSILFLYDGPNGTSLVLVHGHYQGSQSGGGSVSMTFTGLPEDGEWVVEDDRYDGSMNYDEWNHEGTRSEIDWTYRFSRTDGGAFRGLDGEFELVIEPAFNDESEFGDQYYDSELADWQVLSGDLEEPTRTSLAMDQPVMLVSAGCASLDDTDDDGSDEEDGDERETEDDGTAGDDTGGAEDEESEEKSEESDEETNEDETEEEDGEEATDDDERKESEDEDDGDDDRTERKHEKQREKHRKEEKKHERKQRKHQKKHEKQQRKHEKAAEKRERKHEKRQRKHEKAEERRERKHEKRQRKHEKKEEKRGRKHERKAGAEVEVGEGKANVEVEAKAGESRKDSGGLGDGVTDTVESVLGSDEDDD